MISAMAIVRLLNVSKFQKYTTNFFDGKDDIFLDVSDIYPARPGNRKTVECIDVPNICDSFEGKDKILLEI